MKHGENSYQLVWKAQDLKDYYLREVLMHEIGHIIDDRNTNPRSRESFADAFATEFGYLPYKAHKKQQNEKRHKIRRTHHK